jgi:molecular chaperone GrpE
LSSHNEQQGSIGKDKPREKTNETKELGKTEARKEAAESRLETPKGTSIQEKEKEIQALRKSLEEEKNKAEQYLTSLKYLKAEFENYQKRTAKDMDELVKRGSERLARKLLNVVDDFETTIKASKAVGESSKLLSGVEMIQRELMKILRSEGIERIDAVGKKFDPELHEAMMVTKTDKCPQDTVVEELRPGYMFDGRVLRPSMVSVARPPDKVTSEGEVRKLVAEASASQDGAAKGINKKMPQK